MAQDNDTNGVKEVIEDGKLTGKDTETDETVPLQRGPMSIEDADIGTYLSRPRRLRVPNPPRRRWQSRGESWDNFEDDQGGSGDTASGRWTGDITIQSNVVYAGSQAAELTPDGGSATVSQSGLSLDVSGKGVSLALRTTAPPTAELRVRFLDSSSNLRQHMVGIGSTRGGESWTRVDPGVSDGSDSSFDPTDVTEIQIWVTDISDSETVWIDDVRFVDTADKGYFMFIFDDGDSSHYDTFYPILEKYGYKGAFAVHTDHMGESGRLTWDEARELQALGNDIISHLPQHATLTDKSVSELDEMFRSAKQSLLDNGIYEKQAEFIAYPGGQYDEEILEVAERYHSFGLTSFANRRYGMNPLRITAPLNWSRGGQSLTNYQNMADWAADWNQVTGTTIHEEGNEMTASEFEDLCDYVYNTENLEVITVSQFYDEVAGTA